MISAAVGAAAAAAAEQLEVLARVVRSRHGPAEVILNGVDCYCPCSTSPQPIEAQVESEPLV